MVAQVGYSVARRSRGQVALCTVCTVHVETRNAGFLVMPQNQGRRFVSGGTVFFGLASKPVVTVFSSLVSKPAVTVSSSLASKSLVLGFPV
jgi:hypothetical protein